MKLQHHHHQQQQHGRNQICRDKFSSGRFSLQMQRFLKKQKQKILRRQPVISVLFADVMLIN
jgi:hypothetical protein